ncbi:MAG: hypothetical protein IIY73_03100, partial [Solobacterium sp.]|nr:hypothetical protein [Solobacterium sp.]
GGSLSPDRLLNRLQIIQVPSIAMVLFGCLGLFTIFLTLRYTSLGLIGILLANNLTYILYYVVFLPWYAGKQMEGIHTHLPVLVLLTVLFTVLNTIAGRILIPASYLSLFGFCVPLCMLGWAIVMLLTRTHPRKLIRFFAER